MSFCDFVPDDPSCGLNLYQQVLGKDEATWSPTEYMQLDQSDKCYALALSSGDQSSMYQAGVIKGLIEAKGSSAEFGYQAISGVQGGAMNAALLANFAIG